VARKDATYNVTWHPNNNNSCQCVHPGANNNTPGGEKFAVGLLFWIRGGRNHRDPYAYRLRCVFRAMCHHEEK